MKNLIIEINRTKEIMGLEIISEQLPPAIENELATTIKSAFGKAKNIAMSREEAAIMDFFRGTKGIEGAESLVNKIKSDPNILYKLKKYANTKSGTEKLFLLRKLKKIEKKAQLGIRQRFQTVGKNINDLQSKELNIIQKLLNSKPIYLKIRDVFSSHSNDIKRIYNELNTDLDKYVEDIYSILIKTSESYLKGGYADITALRTVNSKIDTLASKYKTNINEIHNDIIKGLRNLTDSNGKQLIDDRTLITIKNLLEKNTPLSTDEKTVLEELWGSSIYATMLSGVNQDKSKIVKKFFNIFERVSAGLITGSPRKFREYYPYLKTVRGSVKLYFMLQFLHLIVIPAFISLGMMGIFFISHYVNKKDPEYTKFNNKLYQLLKTRWENIILDETGEFNVGTLIPFEYVWGDIKDGWEDVMSNKISLQNYILSKKDKYDILMKKSYEEFKQKHPEFSKDEYDRLKQKYSKLGDFKQVPKQTTQQSGQTPPKTTTQTQQQTKQTAPVQPAPQQQTTTKPNIEDIFK